MLGGSEGRVVRRDGLDLWISCELTRDVPRWVLSSDHRSNCSIVNVSDSFEHDIIQASYSQCNAMTGSACVGHALSKPGLGLCDK